MTNHAHVLLIGLLTNACVNDPPEEGTPVPIEQRRLPGTGGIMAPPSDPEEAIRSEFATVERKGTAQAYTIFAQRHPAHPLAQEAMRRAVALDAKSPPRTDPAPCPNADPHNCDPKS